MNGNDYFTAGEPKKRLRIRWYRGSRTRTFLAPAITITIIALFLFATWSIAMNFLGARDALIASMIQPKESPPATQTTKETPNLNTADPSTEDVHTIEQSNTEPTSSANEPVTVAPLPATTPVTPDKPYRELLNLSFDASPEGTYTRTSAVADMNNRNGSIISFGATPSKSLTLEKENGNGYLVKKMPKGTYNTTQSTINEGHATNLSTDHKLTIRWKLNQSLTSALFSYKVKTNKGFNPVLGGKLPGLCGGTCPIGGTPTTDAAELSNGNNNPNGKAIGFSARNMWRQGGNLVQYLYYPDQKTNWAPDFFYTNATGQRIAFNDGNWHTITHYIRMDTPGKKDGILQAWVDNVPYLSLSNVRLRDDASYGIDTVLITTYFGGHDPKWATTKDESLYFDDIKLMTND